MENGDVIMASYVTSATVDGRVFGEALVPVSLITIGSASLLGDPPQKSSIRVWFDARKAGTIERIPTLT
ncbi:hypothetical protein, partial [Enhygromyxa salina]|uniref:hypothetical protein n=1 Tax=Enhygromyxa salina TaxID=215803 RepID=UPI001969EDF4